MAELSELAEGIGYARSIIDSHAPVNPGPGRTRCPVCEAWYPCDLVSLAALAVLEHNQRATVDAALTESRAATARAEQALAVLMDFAQASFAAEERYAMGKALPPEWERDWAAICERTKALLLAASRQPEAGAAETEA